VTSTDADNRTAFIDGLLALACFLEAHPDVPVPGNYRDTLKLIVFPGGDTDEEKRAGVDDVAVMLGVTAEDPRDIGQYCAALRFGPVTYEACAITRKWRERSRIGDSHQANPAARAAAVAA
jgi:hypothetical protein